MKLNTYSIIRPVSKSLIALLFIAGLNNLAIADNAATFLKENPSIFTLLRADIIIKLFT